MLKPAVTALISVSLAFSAAHAQPQADVAGRYLDCLERFCEYSRTIWHESSEPPESGYFGDGASRGNGGIRGNCGVVVAYATLLRAGRGDRKELIDAIRKGLRYSALTHRVGEHRCRDGKQWGGSWQSALWAGSLAFAAAVTEDELDPALIDACKRVIAFEADRLADIPPRSGWRGDSKAEENGWDSNALALGAAWLSEDPRAAEWTAAAKRYLANTYTVADTSGDPLAEWVTTTTLYPSFTCENHGFFHPSYQMVSGMSMGDSLLMAKAINGAVAAELEPFAEHNVLPVWERLTQVLLDSGELAYPSGLDWSLHGYGQISYLAWLAAHFDDPTGVWAEQKLAGHMAYRQRVGGDGRFTGDSVPNGFYREAVMARRVAMAWWQHHLDQRKGAPAKPPEDFVEHIPDVRLILQRCREGFISLSYGARIMGMVVPTARGHGAKPYVTTPRYPGVIGPGTFGDPKGIDSIEVKTRPDGFEAALTVRFGPLESRRVKFVSFGDSVAIIEAPQLVVDVEGPPPPAFPVGIENHALTGGARNLEWEGGRRGVEAMCGVSIEPAGHWTCVSERLGYIAGPEGSIRYDAAGGYNRRGAAEDHLYFMPASEVRVRYAIIVPAADADGVCDVAESVNWEAGEKVASLEFVSPRGQERIVKMALPMPPAERRTLVRPDAVEASTESDRHPARLAIDGDPRTFWVSSYDGPVPGHGPTPERPEWLQVQLRGNRQIDEVIIVPRPRYGPKDISFAVDGEVVYSGRMTASPLRVTLKEPIAASEAQLTMTSSHDPRHPDNPRNVQVAEILFIDASPEGGEGRQ